MGAVLKLVLVGLCLVLLLADDVGANYFQTTKECKSETDCDEDECCLSGNKNDPSFCRLLRGSDESCTEDNENRSENDIRITYCQCIDGFKCVHEYYISPTLACLTDKESEGMNETLCPCAPGHRCVQVPGPAREILGNCKKTCDTNSDCNTDQCCLFPIIGEGTRFEETSPHGHCEKKLTKDDACFSDGNPMYSGDVLVGAKGVCPCDEDLVCGKLWGKAGGTRPDGKCRTTCYTNMDCYRGFCCLFPTEGEVTKYGTQGPLGYCEWKGAYIIDEACYVNGNPMYYGDKIVGSKDLCPCGEVSVCKFSGTASGTGPDGKCKMACDNNNECPKNHCCLFPTEDEAAKYDNGRLGHCEKTGIKQDACFVDGNPKYFGSTIIGHKGVCPCRHYHVCQPLRTASGTGPDASCPESPIHREYY